MKWIAAFIPLLLLTFIARAQIPAPAKDLADWPMPYAGTFPAISATDLLDKPAGRNGGIVVRDGHFFTGDKRIRFWGVNLAFGGCFPTHEQADAVALRLSTFGINAVRFHHMDNQRFPNGIFADKLLEKLSPEALDRLDYFIDALAKQGVYSNINLHVSRDWSKTHDFPRADRLPGYDKMVDLIHDDLIAADRQYARDLLTHVNAYRNVCYAQDPAICMIEINNENSLFLWGGEKDLANLPEPYAGLLNKGWNRWLVRKYATRSTLDQAWAKGATPLGKYLLTWELPPDGDIAKHWSVEQHGKAKMTVTTASMPNHTPGVQADVTATDGTDWHLQIGRPGIKLEKGKFYTVSLTAMADVPTSISLGVSQAHAPWENLGLAATLKLVPSQQTYSYGFVANDADENARVSLVVGGGDHTVTFSPPTLREGGQLGLANNESPLPPEKNEQVGPVASHRPGGMESPARSADWFDFLQERDENYFFYMREFLLEDCQVQAPITGTIGLGPLGTRSQVLMDFVDAHAYWDHPHFPHKQWDMKDWQINNEPMVDHPDRSPLFGLAATHVLGKPFTVTEYNHAAPNEWAAEGVPMVASFAALQDWDAVFLFAYSHNGNYDKQHLTGFFDIEGDPAKMAFLPLAARMLLGRDTVGAITPLASTKNVILPRDKMLATGSEYYHKIWPFVREVGQLDWQAVMNRRLTISYDNSALPDVTKESRDRLDWTANGDGTGRYVLNDYNGAIFTGFAPKQPVDIGGVRIEKLDSPFASIVIVPDSTRRTTMTADRLLIAAVARVENTDMKRSPDRKTVGTNWGKSPVKTEVVRGELSLPGEKYVVYAITPQGTRGEPIVTRIVDGRCVIPLGTTPTVWYEIIRTK